jgi:hypothetical protein
VRPSGAATHRGEHSHVSGVGVAVAVQPRCTRGRGVQDKSSGAANLALGGWREDCHWCLPNMDLSCQWRGNTQIGACPGVTQGRVGMGG